MRPFSLRVESLEAREVPAGVSFTVPLNWHAAPDARPAGAVSTTVPLNGHQAPADGPDGAVMVAAREAARRTQCNNNLEQTGLVVRVVFTPVGLVNPNVPPARAFG